MKELFIDIETAPLYATIGEYPKASRDKLIHKYDDQAYQKAGLHAEFARIVCISCGYMKGDEVVTKTYHGSESELLTQLGNGVGVGFKYIGHNIIDFDIPFIQRRIAINGIRIPQGLKTRGMKPWDLDNMMADTMKMWSSTAWNYRVSLNVLCEILGVPSPKDGIDGSMVGQAFYEGRIQEIIDYCERDVEATARVYRILKDLGM